MARVIGNAGRSANIEAVFARIILPSFLGVFLLPLFGILMLASRRPFGLLACLIVMAGCLWWWRTDYAEIWRSMRDGGAWKKGAAGERRVGNELARLPDDFIVFHDFHFRSGEKEWHDWNVDHIVVGPTGVFVIETKNYTRARIRNAAADHYTEANVHQVRGCAMDLKKRLIAWSNKALTDTFVEGWLVYAQQGASVDQQWEGQTHVVPSKWLVRDIQSRPKRDIDWEQSFRVALVLWNQLSSPRRELFADEWANVVADHKALREKHFEKLRTDKMTDTSPSVDPLPQVCPRCGAPLVRRVAKRGERKGKPFLGCSRWRETGCKFVHNLDQPAA